MLAPMGSCFLLGLVAGLLATPHCAGMCGVFPLCLARAAGRVWPRQALYHVGRLLTSAFLGALAGAFGQVIVDRLALGASGRVLAYSFGVAMLLMGAVMLGARPAARPQPEEASGGGLLRSFAAHFAAVPGPLAGLLLGVATEFLPCGITLAVLAFCVATHSALLGSVTMLGLGLGAVPVLLAIGLSAALLDARVRLLGLRAAGILMLALGLLALARPTGLLCRYLPGEASWSYVQHATPRGR